VNPAAKTETVLPLAAFFQLTENPHRGHPLPTAALYPGITLAISNTASGLHAFLYDSGRRSRSTGKERDAETNNDFFQARYLSAFQGRFTSPDPAGNFVADTTNQQSWNLYSYVWNNPLALIDPSGLSPVGPDYGSIYWSGNCAYQDVTYGEGRNAFTDTIDVGCLPTGQQTSSATRIPANRSTPQQVPANNCVRPTAIQRFGISATKPLAHLLGKTLLSGLGGSAGAGSGQGIGIYASTSVQIAVSPNGNAAYVLSFSAPSAVTGLGTVVWVTPSTKGYGALGGSDFGFSNATDPSQLAGHSVDLSGTMAVGLGIGADISTDGSTYQANVTAGWGIGGRGSVGAATNTIVIPFCHE
jgi:RHS repeat-associated protein